MLRKRFPLICFHMCSSDLLMVTEVSLHINFELQEHHPKKRKRKISNSYFYTWYENTLKAEFRKFNQLM